MPVPRRPEPEPLRVDMRLHVRIGTALWALALVVLLPFWQWLSDTGRLWWLATCGAGVVLGMIGLVYLGRLERPHDRG